MNQTRQIIFPKRNTSFRNLLCEKDQRLTQTTERSSGKFIYSTRFDCTIATAFQSLRASTILQGCRDCDSRPEIDL